ncbi:hypothetical protein SGLAM104S_06605 [Streptomyces glaucescens]
MMMGTTVYSASMGTLYRVCGGISTLVRLRRWKMALQRIKPHTSTPTASAAAQEPCQRERTIGASSVVGVGIPRRGKSSHVQPVAVARTRPAVSACSSFRRIGRRGERSEPLGLT